MLLWLRNSIYDINGICSQGNLRLNFVDSKHGGCHRLECRKETTSIIEILELEIGLSIWQKGRYLPAISPEAMARRDCCGCIEVNGLAVSVLCCNKRRLFLFIDDTEFGISAIKKEMRWARLVKTANPA